MLRQVGVFTKVRWAAVLRQLSRRLDQLERCQRLQHGQQLLVATAGPPFIGAKQGVVGINSIAPSPSNSLSRTTASRRTALMSVDVNEAAIAKRSRIPEPVPGLPCDPFAMYLPDLGGLKNPETRRTTAGRHR